MDSSARWKHIIISVLFILAAINFTRTTFNILKSSSRLETLESEVTVLEQERDQLAKNIEFKKSDDYIEERARNDLNLVKPGEKVYVVEGFSDKNKETEPKPFRKIIETDVLAGISSRAAIEEESGFKDSNLYLWYRLFF